MPGLKPLSSISFFARGHDSPTSFGTPAPASTNVSATSLPGARVVSVLDQLVAMHGVPHAVRCDNGPELISEALRDWSERRGVALHFIQPGKPNQNAYIERFNRTYRREVLDAAPRWKLRPD